MYDCRASTVSTSLIKASWRGIAPTGYSRLPETWSHGSVRDLAAGYAIINEQRRIGFVD